MKKKSDNNYTKPMNRYFMETRSTKCASIYTRSLILLVKGIQLWTDCVYSISFIKFKAWWASLMGKPYGHRHCHKSLMHM